MTVGPEQRVLRVAHNTAVRAGAEALGKVASLGLMAVLARQEGPRGLGVLVLALAWAELAVTAIDLGFDRYLLRCVARDRSELAALFWNVLRLKAVRAVPVLTLVIAIGWIAYGATTRWTLVAVCGALLLDSVQYTLASVFAAVERLAPAAGALLCQRLVAAAAGVAALAAGLGVVAVAVAYLIASATAVAVSAALLARTVDIPRPSFPAEARERLRRHALPYAMQEVLAVGITRTDALLLAALASPVVVGIYGAAYRLLEATLLVSNALVSAFVAMFSYLPEADAAAAFQRAIKLLLILLAPAAVTLALLAEPLLQFAFGASFDGAAAPLRVLAGTAVVLGVVMMSLALVVSREDPRASVRPFAAALTFNIVLNLILIPGLGATGAGVAMLSTECLLAGLLLRRARRILGPLRLVQIAAGPATGAAAMAVVLTAAPDPALGALGLGLLAYGAGLALVERRLWPEDARLLRIAVRQAVAR